MVDPGEFGEVKAHVANLREDVRDMKQTLLSINEKLDSKVSWKVVASVWTAVSGAAAGLGAWVSSMLHGTPPPGH